MLENYVLNYIIGVKYKRLIERSARILRYNDRIVEEYQSLSKSFKCVDNSSILPDDEIRIMQYKIKPFSIITNEKSLLLDDNNEYKFNKLRRFVFLGKKLEINGKVVYYDKLTIYAPNKFNFNKITLNNETVKWVEKEKYTLGIQEFTIFEAR